MSVQTRPRRRGEQRRQETRGALLSAGQRLFAERALDSVSIDEIVSAADVAKGSFYNHFDDKEQLARAVVDLVQGDCEFHIYAANQDVTDPARRIVRALCVVIGYATKYPERLQALISLSQRRTLADAPLNAGLSADLRNGLAQGHLHGVDLQSGMLIVIGLVRVAADQACTADANGSPADLARAMGRAELRALGVPDPEAEALAAEAAEALLERSPI